MQAICKLDHDHADILCHREKHLAIVLKLYILLRHIFNAAEFRHAVNECHNIPAELGFHLLERGVRILDYIVQESGTNGLIIKMEAGENISNVEGMHDVGIAGNAYLTAVCLLRK